jgi:hypothetical protein
MMKQKILSALDMFGAVAVLTASIAVPFALYFYGYIGA